MIGCSFGRNHQPTERLGVGVVGLLYFGGIGEPGYGKTNTHPPSPVSPAGLLFGDAVKEFAFEVRLIARVRVRAPDEASARQAVPSVIGTPGSAEIALANQGIDVLLPGAAVTAVDFIPDGKAKLVRR